MAEEPKAVVQRLLTEGFNKGDWALAKEIIAPDVRVHRPFPAQKPGRDGLLEEFALIRAAYPDMQTTHNELIADGDKVVIHWTVRGTHQAPYKGKAPTNAPVTWSGVAIARMVNGQLVEYWDYGDSAAPGSPRHIAHGAAG